MSAKIEMEWNPGAIRQIRTSPQALSLITQKVQRAAQGAAPIATHMGITGGRGRAHGRIVGTDRQALLNGLRAAANG